MRSPQAVQNDIIFIDRSIDGLRIMGSTMAEIVRLRGQRSALLKELHETEKLGAR